MDVGLERTWNPDGRAPACISSTTQGEIGLRIAEQGVWRLEPITEFPFPGAPRFIMGWNSP